jgi:hypothetical protein
MMMYEWKYNSTIFHLGKNATNITLDSEPTKTRSSKQEKKTDDLKETGQLT